MASVTGQGNTYNLPNYHGELFTVTPTETPFLSAIGGLFGGAKITKATTFEWQTQDRRSSTANNVVSEGAAAPAGTERSRSAVDNVVEIHQSAIEITYSKLAATGQFNSANIAPQVDDAVLDELTNQTMAELQSMAVDIEKSFLSGLYNKPADNTTNRQTRGILTAIQTNRVSGGTAVGAGTATVVAATGVFTTPAANTLAIGNKVYVHTVTNLTGLVAYQAYYVLTVPTSSTFTVSTIPGGATATFVTDGSVTGLTLAAAISKTTLDSALKTAFDNGAKLPMGETVIMLGSGQKLALSNGYAIPALNQVTRDRTVGGVAVDTLVTDFGTFGVMLNRWMPAGQIAVLDLSVCAPWFMEIPDKGLLFTEPLSTVGSSRKWQLYGEVGLEYGPETYHALITDLV
jgi:hypothetical protein